MIRTVITAAFAVLSLAACGEKPQDLASGKKPDVPSWQGTDNAYAAPGWKSGDRKAWEEHLKARAQGQNEYTRTGGGKS